MKKNNVMEDEREDKEHTHQNHKRHISPVNLFWCRKMMAMCCFVWLLALQLWSVSEAVKRRLNFGFRWFQYSATWKCLHKCHIWCYIIFKVKVSFKDDIWGSYNCQDPYSNSTTVIQMRPRSDLYLTRFNRNKDLKVYKSQALLVLMIHYIGIILMMRRQRTIKKQV